MPNVIHPEGPMRYYRDQNTGELVRWSFNTNSWAELRCDESTRFECRWVNVDITAEDVPGLAVVSRAEADQYRREVYQANAAARGEAFLSRMRSTGMGF